MFYVTFIVNQIYVKCSWHIEYDPKKTKPNRIRSLENQAKEGLTLRLKLEHFPILH